MLFIGSYLFSSSSVSMPDSSMSSISEVKWLFGESLKKKKKKKKKEKKNKKLRKLRLCELSLYRDHTPIYQCGDSK